MWSCRCICFPTASETLASRGFTNLAVMALAFQGEHKSLVQSQMEMYHHVKLPRAVPPHF